MMDLQHCKRAFLEDNIKGNTDAMEVARLANSLYHNEYQRRIGVNGWTVQDNLKWRQVFDLLGIKYTYKGEEQNCEPQTPQDL